MGDSVVTVPYTFFSTAGAIENLGARPIFVDIDDGSFGMAPERLSALLEQDCTYDLTKKELTHRSSKTKIKAVVPVHLYGQCSHMDAILDISRRYDLPVVEDSCQALGAQYRGKMAGSMGDLGCFSFFPTKNLGGAGDGGMVVSRHRNLAERVKQLRNHGANPKYFYPMIGFNSRLDEIQAAVLRVKLGHLNEWIRARQRNAADYERGFEAAGVLEHVRLPSAAPHRSHTFHQYVIRCPRRDELRTFLQSRLVGTEIYYPLSLHEQESFRKLGYTAADFPQSRNAAKTTLALPVYPELTDEQKSHVIGSVAEFYRQHS
jgi:dTDP-4-amino-4,6-dideoxygalactose transaminase